MPENNRSTTALAFDVGLKNIGVAVGQTLLKSATPLSVLKARNGQPDWLQVETLVETWKPTLLLVGLPLNMDGSESKFCLNTRKFARRLKGRFGIPALMIDERLSTREAKERSGSRDSYKRHPVDDLAAQVILESWLNSPQDTCEP